MKKTLAFILAICLCVGLCACGSGEEKETTPKATPTTEPTEEPETVITGKRYICTKVQLTDEEYDEFEIADSVHNKLFNSTVVISEDRSVLVYTNQMGEYTADLVTEYDGEMWYESEVTWRETPTPYGDHAVTATSLIFDEARGLVRMNFSLDGEIGNTWSGTYFVFNEFELE